MLTVSLIPCFLWFQVNSEKFTIAGSTLAIVAITMFMLAGFTDMIDGTIARKVNKGKTGGFGASLDGISDMIMVFVTFVFFTPLMDYGAWLFPTLSVALIYKVGVGVFGHLRHGSKSILIHTWAMKFLGLILFLAPIFYFFSDGAAWVEWYIVGMLVYLVFTITEELLIHILLKGSSQDIKTVFHYKRENERILAKKAAAEAEEEKGTK